MSKLIIMLGIPRSGKSTLAGKIAKRHGGVIVSPDAVRLAMYNQPFVQSMEDFVWATVKVMTTSLMLSNHKLVILDATNLSRKGRDVWRSKAASLEYETRVVCLRTPLEECLKRATESNTEYLVPTIKRMSQNMESTPESDFDDIDSTHMSGELPKGFLDTLFR